MDIKKLYAQYDAFKSRGLHLDMSRGKPCTEQLNLSEPVLHALDGRSDYLAEDGIDVRNYGAYLGVPEARRLFGEIFELPMEQVIVGGNSSINLIHDALTRAFINGPMPGDTPWGKLDKVRFLIPVPAYDWHIHICETFGIEPVPVPMDEFGPDMDTVEELVKDPLVKGLLCTPMYSNPTGVTFSDRVVERLAAMKTAAPDFRIFWDNAYSVHHLYPDKRDHLANIYEACVRYGHEDRVYLFGSTSKITFPGGGIAAMAGSPATVKRQGDLLQYQLVCYNKINQLRHAVYFPNKAAVERHMEKHAAIIRPKFDCVCDTLAREVADIASWHKPLGGYFVCFYTKEPDCAKRIVELCQEAGVKLTPAGAQFPGGVDEYDNMLRLAPTYPPIHELEQAMELFCIAVKIATLEAQGAEGARKQALN